MKHVRFLALASIALAGCAIESSPNAEHLDNQSQALPQCDDEGGCGPNDDPPPPPPPPPLVSSIPDVAMELVLPRPCTTPGIQTPLEVELAKSFPGAQRSFLCLNGNTARIGLWLRPLGAKEDADARARGLAQTAVIYGGETAGFRVPSTVLAAKVESAWAEQPKVIDHEGNVTSDGPVFLTSKNLAFDGANQRIAFTAYGKDTLPVPDVNFNFQLSSTFSTQNGKFLCSSATEFHADTTWQWALGGLFLAAGVIAPCVSPFTTPVSFGFFVQGTIISSFNPNAPGLGGVSFCDSASVVPEKILLQGTSTVPKGQKMVFDYSRASTDAGITAAGLWTLNARVPTLQVAGTRSIDILVPRNFAGPLALEAIVTVKSDDMITPTFTFAPESGGAMTTVAGQPDRATFRIRRVRWQVPSATVGQQFTRTFSASAKDVEDLQASGSTFFVFHVKKEPTDPTTQPPCQAKPWLPQCN